MSEFTWVILLTLLAGIAIPIGAIIASVENIRPHWLENEFRHGVIAFGGGALLSAVALVLVPEGIKDLPPIPACLYLVAGGICFMLIDILLFKLNTPATQLVAMLSDFIPESMALGAAFAIGGDAGILLAIIIALQNLPEGFNAFRELKTSTHYSGLIIIGVFSVIALMGPLAGITGYLYLANYPTTMSAIMLFAAGGILYSVFQDIAPQAKLEQHWGPSLGAVLGFVLGLLGSMLS